MRASAKRRVLVGAAIAVLGGSASTGCSMLFDPSSFEVGVSASATLPPTADADPPAVGDASPVIGEAGNDAQQVRFCSPDASSVCLDFDDPENPLRDWGGVEHNGKLVFDSEVAFSAPRSGLAMLELVNAQVMVEHDSPPLFTERTLSFRVMLPLPLADHTLAFVRKSSMNSVLSVGVTGLRVHLSIGTQRFDTPYDLPQNDWVRLDLRWSLGSPSSVTLSANGKQIMTRPTTDLQSGVYLVSVGLVFGDAPAAARFDDILVR
jgi:hypothetical protein